MQRVGQGARRFIYNSDSNNMFLYDERPMSPGDIEPYIDEIAQGDVTTLYYSPNFGMKVNYPSEVAEVIAPLPGDDTRRVDIDNVHHLIKQGHDPLALIMHMASEKGLEFFVSFRLNEVHCVENPESPIVSDFWREHPEWHIGTPGDPLPDLYKEIMGPRVNPIVGSWLPGALNFAVPQVREQRLAELRELCERYTMDGLDLDFQRFPVYFPFGSEIENTGTMTSWVREVREMTRETSAKRGRELLLSARVMARPEQNIALGLDLEAWAEQDLLDIVVVSHYLRNDFPLPISEYRNMLPDDIPIYASIEFERDPDVYRDIARRLWADGVDGLMLFNFPAAREGGRKPPFQLLNELGDPRKLLS